MRITESQLRRVIRDELSKSKLSEGFADDAKTAAIAAALAPVTGIRMGAIKMMVPLFKRTTTDSEAVSALRSAIDGPYEGDVEALLSDARKAIKNLGGIASAARAFVSEKTGYVMTGPVIAALKYLNSAGHKVDDIARAIEALIKQAGAMASRPIEV